MKKWLAPVLFFLVTSASIAGEQSVAIIDAEFWASPRNAEMVLDYAPVAVAVEQLLADPEAYLVLHFPETETGELWGQELQAWLVSLGIISDRIELRSGFAESEGVELLIVAADVEPEPELGIVDIGSDGNEVDLNKGDEPVSSQLEMSTPPINESEVELQ